MNFFGIVFASVRHPDQNPTICSAAAGPGDKRQKKLQKNKQVYAPTKISVGAPPVSDSIRHTARQRILKSVQSTSDGQSGVDSNRRTAFAWVKSSLSY